MSDFAFIFGCVIFSLCFFLAVRLDHRNRKRAQDDFIFKLSKCLKDFKE